jgi:hypothetical protein
MFLLSDYSITSFKRGRRKGSKNKRIKQHTSNTHDKVRNILKVSRESRGLLGTVLGAAKKVRYWLR